MRILNTTKQYFVNSLVEPPCEIFKNLEESLRFLPNLKDSSKILPNLKDSFKILPNLRDSFKILLNLKVYFKETLRLLQMPIRTDQLDSNSIQKRMN